MAAESSTADPAVFDQGHAMSVLDILLGRKSSASAGHAARHTHSTGFSESASSGLASTGLMTDASDARQFTVRRDLLRLVLRDLMTRNAMPTAWLEVHVLAAASRQNARGVHARLVLKHWQPLILEYAPQLERQFIQRLMAMDPLADQWLLGLSWQLELPADTPLKPLPRAGSWTAIPHPHPRPARPEPVAAAAAGGDVIEGPIHIASPADARSDLDRLLADGDRTRRLPASFDATRPAGLS